VPHIGERLGGGLATLVDEGLVADVQGEGHLALAMPSVSAFDAGRAARASHRPPIGTAALAFCPRVRDRRRRHRPLRVGDRQSLRRRSRVSETPASLPDAAPTPFWLDQPGRPEAVRR
jgi:hypothetical protein